jgi:hypothetical protein
MWLLSHSRFRRSRVHEWTFLLTHGLCVNADRCRGCTCVVLAMTSSPTSTIHVHYPTAIEQVRHSPFEADIAGGPIARIATPPLKVLGIIVQRTGLRRSDSVQVLRRSWWMVMIAWTLALNRWLERILVWTGSSFASILMVPVQRCCGNCCDCTTLFWRSYSTTMPHNS